MKSSDIIFENSLISDFINLYGYKCLHLFFKHEKQVICFKK